MESPSPPTSKTSPLAALTLRKVLVARKVHSSSSSSRAQVPRRSFPPDTFTSRIRTARPSPLGPKGARHALAHQSSDEVDWSSDDDEDDTQERASPSTTDADDDGDLGVVKRAKSKKFAKGVGKVRFFSASLARRRERTPSYSPRKEMAGGAGTARLVASTKTPPASHHPSPSKPLRATSTPFTPLASRTIVHHSPTSTKLQPTSWSPESIASGPFLPSPTSSQSSWSLVTPNLPQADLFDTSVDSIIIIHDAANVSEKFVRGNRGNNNNNTAQAAAPLPPPPPPTPAAASTPAVLSPFAKPFAPTQSIKRFERPIDFAELMARGGTTTTRGGLRISSPFAPSSTAMEEKKTSPERQVLMKQILRAVTPSKPSREQVAQRMVRMIMKKSAEMGDAVQKGTAIACMVGPESLPYARNPSGVDGSVVGSDGRLNVWMASAQDPECEHVESFQRRPGAANPILRGSNINDPAHAQAYCHPSAFRIQPHGRGRVIPQAPQSTQAQQLHHQQRLNLAPSAPSPRFPGADLHPCPSPSFSDFSFDSRACFPQPHQYGGPSPPTPSSTVFPPSPLHQHQHYQLLQQQHQLQQQQLLRRQQREQFDEMARQVQQPRAFSNQELFEVASNILGLGHPSTFAAARSQLGSSGGSTPSSSLGGGGLDFQRQASQLERILLLSTIATSLRSASDSVISSSPAPIPTTPRSISSPVPPTIPSFEDAKPLGPPPGLAAPSTAAQEQASTVDGHRVPPPLSLPTIPLPALDDPAIVNTKPLTPNTARPRADTYQVRKDGIPTSYPRASSRSRSNTLTVSASAPTHNHSAHEETFIFLRAGAPPGFANNGARRPGPRAGLPARTMAERAIDAMRKAREREGKVVEKEMEEVLEFGREVGEGMGREVEVRVGELWKKGGEGKEEKKVEEETYGTVAGKRRGKNGGKADATAPADGVLTLGSLSAMFGESAKTNVPAAVPARNKIHERAKSSASPVLPLGLPKKPDFVATTPAVPSAIRPSAAASSPRAPTNASPKKARSRRRPTTNTTNTKTSSSLRTGK